MAEQIAGHFFDHQEIVADLIRKQGLHEGRWKLTLELGLYAHSLPVKTSRGSEILLPGGVVLVQRIGITRTEEVDNLTVDAAEVNPPQPVKSTKRTRKKGAKKT